METNDKNPKKTQESELQENGSSQEVIPGGEAKETDHQRLAMEAAQKAEQEILYMRAEFENVRKRMIRDQETAIKMANKNLITDLLTVVDLFDHAISHSHQLKAKGDSEVTTFVKGIEMTRSELTQLMARFGVELIGEVGETFDPNKHEAISELESKDQPANTISSVVQKGCMLHGRLLKPARVVVVKA